MLRRRVSVFYEAEIKGSKEQLTVGSGHYSAVSNLRSHHRETCATVVRLDIQTPSASDFLCCSIQAYNMRRYKSCIIAIKGRAGRCPCLAVVLRWAWVRMHVGFSARPCIACVCTDNSTKRPASLNDDYCALSHIQGHEALSSVCRSVCPGPLVAKSFSPLRVRHRKFCNQTAEKWMPKNPPPRQKIVPNSLRKCSVMAQRQRETDEQTTASCQ